MSASTGVAPARTAAWTVAMKVFVVITTSPPATSQNRRATSRGAVPELIPTAWPTPAARAKSASKRSRYGPHGEHAAAQDRLEVGQEGGQILLGQVGPRLLQVQ